MNRKSLIIGILVGILALLGVVLLNYLPGDSIPAEGPEEVTLEALPAKSTELPVEQGNIEAQPDVSSDVPVVMREYEGELEGRGRAIQLDDLSGFGVNDPVALYIPQEDSLVAGTITGVEVTASGNRVLVGELAEGGSQHRFVFTVGRHQTFGTFNTTKGQYQLETRDGVGRIISGKLIREGLDFSRPDFVIPKRKLPEEVTPDKG